MDIVDAILIVFALGPATMHAPPRWTMVFQTMEMCENSAG